MSARISPPMAADRRVRVLRALGLVPWTRRAPGRLAEDIGREFDIATSPAANDARVPCAVVLAQHCSDRALDLLGRALSAGGPLLARAGRARMHDGQLVGVPTATAYLVFGEAQAEALRQQLPVDVRSHADVLVVDDLPVVLADGAAKRRLWMALRSLRDKLAAAGS